MLEQLNQLKSINIWPKDKSNPDIGREMWNFTNLSNYFYILANATNLTRNRSDG